MIPHVLRQRLRVKRFQNSENAPTTFKQSVPQNMVGVAKELTLHACHRGGALELESYLLISS